MNLVILDIISNNYSALDTRLELINNKSSILSLTSNSSFYLEKKQIDYLTFHGLISREEFKNNILSIYNELFKMEDNRLKGVYFDIGKYLNQFLYLEQIIKYIKNCNFNKIIYITDRGLKKNSNLLNNNVSLLNEYYKFDKVIQINRNVNLKRLNKVSLFAKYNLFEIGQKTIQKLFKTDLKYDWSYINSNTIYYNVIAKKEVIKVDFSKFKHYFNNINLENLIFDIHKNIKLPNQLVYLEKDSFFAANELLKKNIELYFFQHGSYLYRNLFIKYLEIESAKINFVFNDYTKKLFEELGSKEVHSVGSIRFNQPIKERKKKYDFLYITQGHDYTGNLQYVDFQNSLHSFDGHELYQKHKSIIHLFGTKFKDKKIIIRVHPTVVTTGVYVPFWEMAEPYPNITIDVSISIHTLIEKSEYIISDYFTTEFINRELHYKRDIILFQGAPTPLPEETIEDMKKMFILVETVDDLEDKVENIEEITKNRKRYDDIIEYYSSKKCDTKKVVKKILKKELNARR